MSNFEDALLPAEPTPQLHAVEFIPRTDSLGRAAEIGAHALSISRAIGGIVLANEIIHTPDYQSWRTVGKFVALAATDAEGYLARWGRKRQNKDESIRRPFNSYIDHLTDKTMIDSITFAIGEREVRNGHSTYGKAVKRAAAIYTARDVVTTVDRVIADRQGIDTRAQKAGKFKAVKQYAVTGFALSPLAKTRTTKALLGAAFARTSEESVRSGISLHNSFQEQRNARKV